MTIFKKPAVSILFIGLCFSILSVTGCSRENNRSNERRVYGESPYSSRTERQNSDNTFFTDFSMYSDYGETAQIGDFVIRNEILVLYTGRARHVEIPADLAIKGISSAFSHGPVVSVVIPAQVETMDMSYSSGPFTNCYYLQSITVDPNNKNFASLDGVLFNKDMTEILWVPHGKEGSYTVPNTIVDIRDVFSNRSKLTSVTIPGSVELMETHWYGNVYRNTFNGCTSLTSITVDSGNRNYASADGVLFNKAMTRILWVPLGREGAYTIPNTITAIQQRDFYQRTSLTSVTIPGSVTSIGEEAFYDCKSLTSVTIPNSVTNIGDRAFTNCTSLRSITIPNSVSFIGGGAFSGCTSLSSITVDQNNREYASADGVLFNKAMTHIIWFPMGKEGSYTIPGSITSVARGAFDGRARLTSVTIPDSVTTIGENAFNNCTSLTTVSIPASVIEIGDGAFFNCTRLTSITVDENNANYSSLDGVLFNKHRTWLLRYPRGKTGRYAIPNTVIVIGDNAFAGASGLTAVTIPNSVTTIGRTAFAETGLRSLTIPNSVTEIERGAFLNNPNLTIIGLPDGFRHDQQGNEYDKGGDYFYYGFMGLQRFVVSRNNQHYSTADGVLFNKDRTELIRFPPGRRGSYTIPATVTTIGYKAFYGSAGLTSITIPSSVTAIGNFAFDGCTGLASINIPNSVVDIGKYAFARCTSLTSINISASVTSIGSFAFYNTGLRQINVDRNNQNFVLANGILFRRDSMEHGRYWVAALAE